MTFTAIDAFVEHGDARVVLACDQCQEQVIAFETLDPESVQAFEATEAHRCAARCVACLEPMPADQLDMLACLPCHEDAPEETLAAVNAAFGAMSHDQRMTYLERSLAHARGTIGKVA